MKKMFQFINKVFYLLVIILFISCPLMENPVVDEKIYTITYEGNESTGGIPPIDENNYIEGENITVKGNVGNLTKTGYTFDGWSTSLDSSGIKYLAGDTIEVSQSSITLYADWKVPVEPETVVEPEIVVDVQSVSAGYRHTMILKTDGTLCGNGHYYYGQLGLGLFYVKEPIEIIIGDS